MPSKLNVYPITNPLECIGYPKGWIRKEPKLELNFLLDTTATTVGHGGGGSISTVNTDANTDGNGHSDAKNRNGSCCNNHGATIQEVTHALACSLIPNASSRSSAATSTSTSASSSTTDASQQTNKNSYNSTCTPTATTTTTTTAILTKKQLTQQLASIDKSKPVIIICHGLLSWRNQMLISNLASELASLSSTKKNIDTNINMEVEEEAEIEAHTLRFDFQASGHSPGQWKLANYQQEYKDLCQIARFVTDMLGCRIAGIVGHSQGAAAVLQYASTMEQQQKPQQRQQQQHDTDDSSPLTLTLPHCQCFVNLAGRYLLPNDFNPKAIFNQEQIQELALQGFFHLIKSGEAEAGKNRILQVRQEDIDNRNEFDISMAANNIRESHVLTIHGDNDAAVPVENGYKFDEVISNHTLKILAGADHNFNGLRFMDDLVSSISAFVRETDGGTGNTTCTCTTV